MPCQSRPATRLAKSMAIVVMRSRGQSGIGFVLFVREEEAFLTLIKRKYKRTVLCANNLP
jgi:hypothetical protein